MSDAPMPDPRRVFNVEIRHCRQLFETHDAIEGEVIDALRDLLDVPDAAGFLRLMHVWNYEHQPIEWETIVALASLPKALADALRAGDEIEPMFDTPEAR